jgi:spermidine/putrescine-binding protein
MERPGAQQADRGTTGPATTRRDFVKGAGLGILLGAGAAFRPEAAEAQRGCEVVFRNWGGFFKQKVEEAFARDFERAQGCRVVQDIGATHHPVIVAQKDKPLIDVVILYLADPYLIKDYLSPLDEKEIPNLKNVYPKMNAVLADGTIIGAGLCSQSFGITYNPQKVAKPESWEDLLQPALRGKIAVPQSSYVGVPYLLPILAKARGGGIDKIDPGFAFLADLKKQVLFEYTSAPQLVQAFQRQEVLAAPFFSAWTSNMQAEGIPVDFVAPQEGVLGLFYTLSRPKNCPNPTMAAKLIDLALAPKSQRAFPEPPYSYGPANRTVTLPTELQKKVPYGEAGMAQTYVPDFNVLNKNRDRWIERWNKTMA